MATRKKKNDELKADGGRIERLAELTPAFAKDLLDQLHPNQRRLRKYHVAILANAMKEGRWRWQGDTIKLDRNLRVIDGQHRLAAVILSGVTLKDVLIAMVDDDDAIKSIDQGIGRSLGDMLQTDGKKPIRRTISGAIVAEHFDWIDWRRRMSREEQIGLIDDFPYLDECKKLEKAAPPRSFIFNVGPLSAAIRCLRANHDGAMEFFTAVFSLNPIVYGEPNDQARMLYTWLQQRPRHGKPSSPEAIREAAWKSLRSWNAWRNCETIARLVYTGGEMPKAEP